MTQPRHMSAVETVTSVTAGYMLALVTQAYLFPLFGLYANHAEHMAIAAVFTVISLIRSYCIRRLFVWMGK